MNEVRKRHNEEKITSGQHFCGKCGSLLSSRGSDCVQCNSKEQEMKQNRMTHVKGENKPLSSLLSNRLLPIIAVGFVLGFITFFIIGTASAPDVIYIEPDFGDGGYYDDGYYDDGYYDDPLGIMSSGFYGPGNNVECIFEECVPYGTGGW
jgi:hypothetical protein